MKQIELCFGFATNSVGDEVNNTMKVGMTCGGFVCLFLCLCGALATPRE